MYSARLLRNPIRQYAWGSRRTLAELLGRPVPSEFPQAELWMGAHPLAPSEVWVDEDWIPLTDWIGRDPEGILGREVVRRFGPDLPFLLKVLAVERPLSLQTHPSAAQARAGFEHENQIGVPRDAPERTFRDPNAKPELVCALTRFTALCGFRPIDELVAQIDELRAARLSRLAVPLRRGRDRDCLRRFYEALISQGKRDRIQTVSEAVEAIASGYGEPEIRGWVLRLAEEHPGDPAVLAPLFMNLLALGPGEALFLPAGELHAYLSGTAVEAMANSDNVVRAGPTDKYKDIRTLLDTLTFDLHQPETSAGVIARPHERRYPTPAREFELSEISLAPGSRFTTGERSSIEILFCHSGRASLSRDRGSEALTLTRGSAAVVPAAIGAYEILGSAILYRVLVPPV